MLVKKKWHVFWVQKCKNVQCSEILFQSVFKMFSLRKLKPHVMWLTCTAYMSLICVHTQNILPLLAFKPSGLWQNLFYLGSKISWGKKKKSTSTQTFLAFLYQIAIIFGELLLNTFLPKGSQRFCSSLNVAKGLPWWLSSKESIC